LITGVWKNSLNQVIIWRISYADPDDDVPSLIASLDEKSFEAPLESIEFSFGSRNVVIFDTSLRGDEAQSEWVSFDIAPGRYLVTTHLVRGGRLIFRSSEDVVDVHNSIFWPGVEAFPFHKAFKCLTEIDGESMAYFVRGVGHELEAKGLLKPEMKERLPNAD